MSKSILIDEELFLDLLAYFGEDEPDDCLACSIKEALDTKLDKLIARKLFTDYKSAPTPAEREAARQQYLDHAMISKSFRSAKEFSR